MNENNGFILKPETYSQEEWYEMYKNVVVKYIVLKEDKEVLQFKIDKAIECLEDIYSCFAEEDEMQKDELLDILKEDK